MAKADKRIMLIDNSKFGKSMPFTFAHMENVDILITDRRPPDDITELAEQAQVKVIYE